MGDGATTLLICGVEESQLLQIIENILATFFCQFMCCTLLAKPASTKEGALNNKIPQKKTHITMDDLLRSNHFQKIHLELCVWCASGVRTE